MKRSFLTFVLFGALLVALPCAAWAEASSSQDPYQGAKWQRIAGKGRYDTMQSVSIKGWQPNVRPNTVFVANGASFNDAIACACLAGLYGSPVILTDGQSLSAQAREEIIRLYPYNVVIVGGAKAVSSSVEQDILEALNSNGSPYDGIQLDVQPRTERIAGQRSDDTSALAATALFLQKSLVLQEADNAVMPSDGTQAIVVTGDNYPDAISAAALSYAFKIPVYYVQNGSYISDSVFRSMRECGVNKVLVVGGRAAVSDDVLAQLEAAGVGIQARIGGKTAVDTSVLVAEYATNVLGMCADYVGIATSGDWSDALCGSMLCGQRNAVLLLDDGKSGSCLDFVSQNRMSIREGYVFGGKLAISDETLNALSAAL